MTWPTVPIDVLDRQNDTLSRDQHPKDHDDLQRAVNAIISILGDDPQGGEGSVTARLLLLQSLLTEVQTLVAGVTGDQLHDTVVQVIQDLNFSSTLTHYIFYQRQTADTWVVPHGLGFDPLVTVIRDSPEQVVYGYDLVYANDHMSLTLRFSQAITGRVITSN